MPSEALQPTCDDELRDRIIEDPQFWLEECTQIKDRTGKGLVRFTFNRAQQRYYDEIWLGGVKHDVNAKVRKYGLSTERLGLGLQSCMYNPGRFGMAVAQSEAPAIELAKIVRRFYETSWNYFLELGRNPLEFMPKVTSDSVYGLTFGEIHSQYRVTWSGARGVGRLVVIDDLYCTELQEWGNEAQESLEALLTAQPPGASGARQTLDFNANTNWLSSLAYEVWDNANKPAADKDHNGFTPFFVGVGELPEYYTPEFLAGKRQILGDKRFKLDYPETPGDLYVQRDIAVHDAQLVDAAAERTAGFYLADLGVRPDRVLHGVDTATGSPEGDFQACTSWGWHDGMWWELCAPIHVRIPEDIFAEQVHARVEKYPGVCVVERNVGSAVLVRLKELGTEGLYRHKQRDKAGVQYRQLGYPTTYGNKRNMIADANEMLRNHELGLVTPALISEWKEVEWKHRDDGEEGRGLAGAPDRRGAHDDLWMGSLIAFQGIGSLSTGTWAAAAA